MGDDLARELMEARLPSQGRECRRAGRVGRSCKGSWGQKRVGNVGDRKDVDARRRERRGMAERKLSSAIKAEQRTPDPPPLLLLERRQRPSE